MKSYICIDLETTGFSPDTCDIIEVCAWKIKEGVVKEKYATLVRPVVYVPRNVQQITNITMDMLSDCEPVEPVLANLFEFCEDLPFLGHNLPFDYSFLLNKGKRIGLDFSLKGTRTGIDTLKLCKRYLSLESNKLESVCTALNLPIEHKEFHRASFDVYATNMLYDYFYIYFPNLMGVSTPELLSMNDKKYGKVENDAVLPLD